MGASFSLAVTENDPSLFPTMLQEGFVAKGGARVESHVPAMAHDKIAESDRISPKIRIIATRHGAIL